MTAIDCSSSSSSSSSREIDDKKKRPRLQQKHSPGCKLGFLYTRTGVPKGRIEKFFASSSPGFRFREKNTWGGEERVEGRVARAPA